MRNNLKIISLGAGVQSSALFLMSCFGEIEKADYAIFSDTGAEPKGVYEHLELLKKYGEQYGIPIIEVSAGNLYQDYIDFVDGKRERVASIPSFLDTEGGGMGMRQCTNDYKIVPLRKKTRELMEKHDVKYADIIFGITVDEITRVRDSNVKYAVHKYPLIFEKQMTRAECYRWYDQQQLPKPEKSACFFCPYRKDSEWVIMKNSDPEAFEKACYFDEKIRVQPKMRSQAFLHRSKQPLRDVVFSQENDNQIDLFQNDCFGMCGI